MSEKQFSYRNKYNYPLYLENPLETKALQAYLNDP